jgi:DNA polymerase I-like protein with 3'-5' exonuclease and polymerase domains
VTKFCVAFDHGQIEARVIAMASKDRVFVKALWERYDVHGEWARRIGLAYPKRIGGKQNLSDKKAMKNFRNEVKNLWVFPLFFGATLESASGYLEIPTNILEPLYNEFWKTFEGVATWQQELLMFYRKHGYVECLTGRRRHAPLSRNKCINSPVQGTAADIVLDGMNRLSEMEDWFFQPNMNIHDDLTYVDGWEEDELEERAEVVMSAMLDVPFKFINVPLTVEMSIGPDWCDMEEVGSFSSDTWFK